MLAASFSFIKIFSGCFGSRVTPKYITVKHKRKRWAYFQVQDRYFYHGVYLHCRVENINCD